MRTERNSLLSYHGFSSGSSSTFLSIFQYIFGSFKGFSSSFHAFGKSSFLSIGFTFPPPFSCFPPSFPLSPLFFPSFPSFLVVYVSLLLFLALLRWILAWLRRVASCRPAGGSEAPPNALVMSCLMFEES